MMPSILLFAILLASAVPIVASAHCPLCTAGAGALALLAAYFGVSTMIIGVLIGAFAAALSLWIAGMPRRTYVRYQYHLIAALVFASTVIPIMPLVVDYAPLYVPFIGAYGTTYAVNLYLAGIPFGVLALLLAPRLSRGIGRARGKTIPFQGIIITFVLLILISFVIQILS